MLIKKKKKETSVIKTKAKWKKLINLLWFDSTQNASVLQFKTGYIFSYFHLKEIEINIAEFLLF